MVILRHTNFFGGVRRLSKPLRELSTVSTEGRQLLGTACVPPTLFVSVTQKEMFEKIKWHANACQQEN